MPKIKLTAAAVERIKSPKQGRVEYFDALLPGFALRVTDKGAKSWCVFYRINGRLRRYTIGSYPAFDLKAARKAAEKALRDVEVGDDPAAEKIERRRRRDDDKPDTVANIADRFAERHIGKKLKSRTQDEYRRPINKWVKPHWGHRMIADITRRDIVELLEHIEGGSGPIAARRAYAVIRKLFNWAVGRDIIQATPAVIPTADLPGEETARDRTLTDDEVKAVWAASDGLGYPFGPLYKLLLVSGQRRDEVAGMRWSELDIDGGLWKLSSGRTKGKREHLVPLSALALSVLESVPKAKGNHVFSTTAGERPVSGFSRAKLRADELIRTTADDEESGLEEVAPWRLHDLRRTCVTEMRKLRIPRDVVGAVVNHAAPGVTATHYDQYDQLEEKRSALAAWGRKIRSLVVPVHDQTVVPLARA